MKVLIFEGPDGAGKSTLAEAVAARLDYAVVHHGPYPEVTEGADLFDRYLDSMMPAIRGRCGVVLDRCWISEIPYGLAFRDGRDRLGTTLRARLEALAWVVDARIVLCLPPWRHVLANFEMRKGKEYLPDAARLRTVYDWYLDKMDADPEDVSALPVTTMNPFDGRDHVKELIDG
jgi:hypothetical protein